ncbi:DHHA1 domain-containing protein [Candidatus Vampirococcus lugosii]|uniref:Single-stranded DNA-specific exonuclease, DHH superfamily n=1 Tax=Candidatus Vampirococcus lugosii TaxID=2789015 RepID=A0ABS5QP02_9BACT|nr:DHHA1 domain-containing protein [Candidatus Vampirococcus lugosii]MBS8122331.1 Single-stranded DNA-specific exonuclease, DHH superfamily [Candidatus Vampirococcus lugosii]
MIAQSNNIHEGIVGITAGRLTEKYNKPSVIISIKEKEGFAVASLRGPEYFSVIDMLNYAGKYMERYGGHKQAGGMTVKISNLSTVIELFYEYGENNITEKDLIKSIQIDTKIYPHELEKEKILKINELAPFGEGNREPVFLMENIIFNDVEKVGKKGKGHLKAYASLEGNTFPVMFWGKGEDLGLVELRNPTKLVGKIKKDNYNGGFFVDGIIN